eukprot:7382143-Prymnesium_polylepis.1
MDTAAGSSLLEDTSDPQGCQNEHNAAMLARAKVFRTNVRGDSALDNGCRTKALRSLATSGPRLQRLQRLPQGKETENVPHLQPLAQTQGCCHFAH